MYLISTGDTQSIKDGKEDLRRHNHCDHIGNTIESNTGSVTVHLLRNLVNFNIVLKVLSKYKKTKYCYTKYYLKKQNKTKRHVSE